MRGSSEHNLTVLASRTSRLRRHGSAPARRDAALVDARPSRGRESAREDRLKRAGYRSRYRLRKQVVERVFRQLSMYMFRYFIVAEIPVITPKFEEVI